MRLTSFMRSAVSVRRSRLFRRRSSSLGLGGRTMARTRGSPRLLASKVRRSVSPKGLPVLARRRRREVAFDAASTTWLSIPSPCRAR